MYVDKKNIDRKDKVYLQREYENGNRRELENKMKIENESECEQCSVSYYIIDRLKGSVS